VVFDDGVEAAILAAVVEHFGDGNVASGRSAAGQALAKHQKTLAVGVGKRLEEHGVDHA